MAKKVLEPKGMEFDNIPEEFVELEDEVIEDEVVEEPVIKEKVVDIDSFIARKLRAANLMSNDRKKSKVISRIFRNKKG